MAVPPGLVLFDLGGVLIELRGVSPMADLAGIDDESELWRRWLGCRWVRRFERGDCDPQEFARGVVDDWDLPVGPAEFLDNFASWPVGPFDGAERLVRQTGSTVPVGCLSNTNVLHWEGRAVHWPLMTRFAHRFVSHHMGAVKPDAEAFAHVADALSMPPDRVLLLDDNQLNVDGARAAGLRAERTVGVAGARRALEEAGVLRPADRV
jgi:putative hydrolase of the HAD superfamily